MVYPIARLLATAQVHQGDALVIDHHFSEEGLVFLRDTEYQSSDFPLGIADNSPKWLCKPYGGEGGILFREMLEIPVPMVKNKP